MQFLLCLTKDGTFHLAMFRCGSFSCIYCYIALDYVMVVKVSFHWPFQFSKIDVYGYLKFTFLNSYVNVLFEQFISYKAIFSSFFFLLTQMLHTATGGQ